LLIYIIHRRCIHVFYIFEDYICLRVRVISVSMSVLHATDNKRKLKSNFIKVYLPVFIRASILERSLLFCTMGVSLRSTSLKLPFETFEFDAERPANSDVVSACAMSMASLASEGKKSLANATAVESNIYFLMV